MHSRWPFVPRLLLSLATFAIVAVWSAEPVGDALRDAVFRLGARSGLSYFMSRVYAVGPDGPFFGDDLKTRAFNAAWSHLPWLAPKLLGLTAACAVYHFLTARPLAPGPETRCRRCDYILRGLREPRCPECGERL